MTKLTTLVLWVSLATASTACGSEDSEGLEGGGAGGKGGSAGATGGAAGATSGGAGGATTGGAGGTSTGGGGTSGTGAAPGGGAGGTGGAGATGGAPGGGGTGATGTGGCGGGSSGGACGNDGTTWPANAQAFECQLIDELNAKRKSGTTCGKTFAPPVPALSRNQVLTNNARAHSEDMSKNGYVDVTTPGGVGPMDWSMKGYCGSYVTTDVGGGQANPSLFLATVLNVESECLKLMASYAKGIGVGYYTDATGQSVHMWTLVIGNQP